MDNKNVILADLSTDEIKMIKNFEQEFSSKYGDKVFLLAFDSKK
jgi:hypothetical protein